MTALKSMVRWAEVKMTARMVKHNVPLAFTDHALEYPSKRYFPRFRDSKGIYSSVKTKTT
jgi:hypothetical protein